MTENGDYDALSIAKCDEIEPNRKIRLQSKPIGQQKLPDDEKHKFFQINTGSLSEEVFKRLREKKILSTDIVVLLLITASQSFKSGCSAISTEEMAEVLGYSKLTVRDSVGRLKKAKLIALISFGRHQSWQASPFVFLVGSGKVRGMARMRHLAATGGELNEKQKQSVNATKRSIRQFFGDSESAEDFTE